MKVKELQESVGLDTHSMAEQIFAFAEEHAMNAGAEAGGMNDDDVLRMTQQALSEIETLITRKIEDGRNYDQGAATEREMDADRNMENGETNFKDPDRF